ncbi:hypothetical protein BS47DRAFT_451563 [Hydnum rufescens UP504]|uniref:Uncharacterized protein n=1 Tax=Hydnum rufescens UP504 TaxID=1448309 RepID=A0A9P6B5P0_9AGAM|nr:hypothetical protein BS47DRAFT_451563 [Hydnum rufescens UP504]
MPDAPRQDNSTPSTSMKQSVAEDPSYNVWDAKASNLAHQSPSSYVPASSLTMLRTESLFQCDAGLERRSSMPARSTRPALRAERSSRIPHVGSRNSLASESTTATAYSVRPTPTVSRNPSPARRSIHSKPKAPSRPLPKASGPPAHHPPSASVTNSASTSRSFSPVKISSLPSRVHTHRQPSSERHKPLPIPAPQTTLRSRPASQMSLRLQRPTSVAAASRPATSRPVHSRTSSSESSHATDVTTGVALGPSRLGTATRSGVARPNEVPLRSMRSTTNLMALGTGTSSTRGRTRSNTTSNVTQTGSARATSTPSLDNNVKRGPGTGSMRPPPLPPARTGISRAS